MSDQARAPAPGDIERQALAALRRMRERLDQVEAARREPLAVVGMACRVPGADGVDAFWELLARGGNAIRDIPSTRWDVARYRRPDPASDQTVVHRAGLLDDVQGFDAECFGVAGREAQYLDPQHRLLLEVAWEALDHAGIPTDSLRGSRTGVFVGITLPDYQRMLTRRLPPGQIDAYVVSGNTFNAAAGRISYLLGVHGPSIAMDTACSSSLVAIDRACRSLRDGECRMALAGGVNLLLSPDILLSLSRWGMLAPDGQCKTFDAAADGFVRAEGCGVVVLKRLSDAVADGDRIWALVRGCAVNQDGPSSGLTAPNGLAQAAVFRDALANAGLAPAAVSYIESHGTGTQLGDPIEMEAISSVYGEGRDAADPLWVGAVKTNVGHLEAASGVTGFIKVVLALQHRRIPANLHFQTPSPHIDWRCAALRIPVALQDWTPRHGPRIAAVSGFGFSGTNAHVILEEAPPAPPRAKPDDDASRAGPLLLTLSARSPAALDALALRHAARLEGDPAIDAATYTLAAAAARAHGPWRLAVTAPDAAALVARLRSAAASSGPGEAGVWRAQAGSGARPRVAFLFTGQGAQYSGMGRELAQAEPVFRAALEEAAAVIDPLLGDSLLDLMWDPTRQARLHQTVATQPALFALAWALVRLWQERGVTPAVVAGHSVGEFAAACCAGVLTLAEAARLVTLRGALMQARPAGGAMAAVAAGQARVAQAIAALPAGLGVLAIAGLNADDETVVSGDGAAVAALAQALAGQGVRCEALQVSHAFHSPLMQPVQAALAEAAAGLQPRVPQVGVVSTLTGEPADAGWGSAAYWARQVVAPVRFAQAVRQLAGQASHVIEIGPHPVLCGLGRRNLPDAAISWWPALRRGASAAEVDRATLAQAYVAGVVGDWSGAAGRAARTAVVLPSYPFQRQRFWVDEPETPDPTVATPTPGQGLLGRAVPLAADWRVFETRAGGPAQAVLRDHRLQGRCVWPGSATIELGLQAASRVLGPGPLRLGPVEFIAPLVLDEPAGVTVQTVLRPARAPAGGEWDLRFSQATGHAAQDWAPFAQAAVRRALVVPENAPGAGGFDAWPALPPGPQPADVYDGLAAHGAEFGAAFRSLREIRQAEGVAAGHVACDAGDGLPREGLCLHPVLLDGCFHLALLAGGDGAAAGLWVPQQVAQIHWWRPAADELWCRAVMRDARADRRVADLELRDRAGHLLARVEGLVLVRVQDDASAHRQAQARALLARAGYEGRWMPAEPAGGDEPARAPIDRWLVVAGAADSRDADGLAAALVAAGAEVVQADADDAPAAWRLAAQRWPGLAVRVAACPGLQAGRPDWQAALHQTVALLQAGAAAALPVDRLWLLTRGAQAVPATPTAGPDALVPAAAAWWGLARTASAELPQFGVSVVDLPAGGHDAAEATTQTLVQVLREAPALETQWTIRGETARVLRWAPLAPRTERRLAMPDSGQIDDLHWVEFERPRPGPGEVLIDVTSAGLNFRDVLCTLGLYPGRVEALGAECAGVVAALGPGVDDLAVGDAVMAFAPGALATAVCVPRAFVVPRPAGLDADQAAALPIAAMTAIYGLEHLGQLQRGERVLIHAGAGGVGGAAVRIALAAGAVVHATAGTPAKRQALRALGVQHVHDSRSLAFRDDILALGDGRGVDLVLNSLSGEFVDASFAALAPGGRFLEMGKRDLLDAAAVEQRWPGRGYRYQAFDLGEACVRDPALAARLLADVVSRLDNGTLSPLPVQAHALSSPCEAFRAMAQGRHSGKLVLRQDLLPPVTAARLRPEARYLVTGGLGALGLAVAEGLVARGARHVVLAGRHGPGERAKAALARMAQAGAQVEAVTLDVSDEPALRRLLSQPTGTPPWRGIVHAAGVVDDAVIERLDATRLDGVMAPKWQGTAHLHALAQGLALDFLVYFSAGAAWLGAAGQAGYAAANATLDAWAQAGRARGVPALSIAWGRWAGAGMAAARDDRSWESVGMAAIPVEEGVETMFELIRRGMPQVAVLPLDWPQYLARLHGQRVPRAFAQVLREAAPAASAPVAAPAGLRARLAREPVDARAGALRQQLEAILRRVVGLPAGQPVDPQRPLRELGMDSLMTVELRNAVGGALDLPLPATVVFDHPTLQALANHLMALMPELQGPGEAPPSAGAAAALPGQHDSSDLSDLSDLSDEEAEALLLRELDGGGAP